jgi:hypothetical protein
MISIPRGHIGSLSLSDGAEQSRVGQLLQPHVLVMGLIFLGALVAGFMLLPGDDERIAMLERDGRDREALQSLQQRYRNGDHSQRTLFQMHTLQTAFGELAEAKQTLEMLAAQRPTDAKVQRQLAVFYRNTQNETGYIAALRRQLGVRYSEPVCRELVGLYSRNGDYANEQQTLADCRARGFRRPDDIIRYAYLVAADGQLSEAAALLKSVDDRRRLRVDRDRHMLFNVLLDTDQAVDAQRRAARWFKGSHDDALALDLIDGLAQQQRYDLAIDLAREIGTKGDAVSLSVAELMLEREELVAARVCLRGWLDAARLRDIDVAQRFIAAALDAEEPQLAFLGAERFGLKRLPQADLAALAEGLSAVGGTREFQLVRDTLEPETLAADPLLAAAVEVDRGQSEPARQLLGRVPVDELDEWRLALWSKLMETTGGVGSPSLVVRDMAPPTAPAITVTTPGSRVLRRMREARHRRAAQRRAWRVRSLQKPPAPGFFGLQPSPQPLPRPGPVQQGG